MKKANSIHVQNDIINREETIVSGETNNNLIADTENKIQTISAPESRENKTKFDKHDFLSDMKYWAINSNINHSQLRGLLKLLNDHVLF